MELIFTQNSTVGSWLIRFFTRRSWVKTASCSHVALRFGTTESNWMVEATRHGFLPNFWPAFTRKQTIVKRFEILAVSEELLSKIIDNQLEILIGKKYDFMALVGFAIVVVWYWITGKKIHNFLGRKRLVYCTEVIYRIFEDVKKETGIEYFKNMDEETIFPEEMLQDVESKPEMFKEILQIL